MRLRHLPLVALLLVTAAVPAHALNWSLGANLGLSLVMADDSDNDLTAFAWPANVLPGLRVGFHGDDPRHEFYLDNSYALSDGDGFSTHSFGLTANYQHNFATRERVGVFLTGGLGLVNQGIEVGAVDVSAMAPILGVGVGLRHRMGNGHGILRGELRFDFRDEGDDDGVLVFDDATIVSIKLGFDFWDR